MDDEIPIIAGSETNDDPFAPISKLGQDMVADLGEQTPIEWNRPRPPLRLRSSPRRTSRLQTSSAKWNPIRVAEGRYLSDELTIHYGLIPRTNRGIFAINELPDLAERIQVGLFNIMEERDIQIRGYRIRLSLDVFLVSSANPEDYTNAVASLRRSRTATACRSAPTTRSRLSTRSASWTKKPRASRTISRSPCRST